MPATTAPDSARAHELLDLAYRYVQEHGLSGMSLRPLAAEIGSSPRVLLFLFGSKDGLVRALLRRARADETAMLDHLRRGAAAELSDVVSELWSWLADPEHRALLVLWTESYARSLVEPDGPWGEFAATTVADLLDLLARAQSPQVRRTRRGESQRTLALALLRGAMLDLLATGDRERTTRAIRAGLAALPGWAGAGFLG